jgi:hypothetical protein
MLDGLASIPGSAIFFYSPQRADHGAHPASYPMSTVEFFPGLKRQGLEANYLD